MQVQLQPIRELVDEAIGLREQIAGIDQHAADGSGQNWIGSFLEPHPRNLTDPQAMAGMTDKRLREVIENGLPGTTMSAWKSVLGAGDIDAIIAYISRVFYPIQKSAGGK